MGNGLYYSFAAGSFHTKKLCSRLHLTEIEFYSKNKKSLFGPPFGDLGAMHILHLQLVEKPMVDFLFVINELFLLSLKVETLQLEICQSQHFSKGVSANFRWKGASPTNHCWC